MTLFDIFILTCILLVVTYTYTKRTMVIIETYRGQQTTKPTVNNTEKRLKALEKKVNFLTKVIGFKHTTNKKSLFQRLTDVEEEVYEQEGEGGGGDDFEYQLPEA